MVSVFVGTVTYLHISLVAAVCRCMQLLRVGGYVHTWDPLVLGPAFAMLSAPVLCGMLKFSSGKVRP